MAFKKIEWGDDKKITRKDLVELMPFALEAGRHEFITEFIEREDVVTDYLTIENLRKLYQNVLHCTTQLNSPISSYQSSLTIKLAICIEHYVRYGTCRQRHFYLSFANQFLL